MAYDSASDEEVLVVSRRAGEIFEERCSSLYNLILDAIHDYSTDEENTHEEVASLSRMESQLAEQGRQIVEKVPALDTCVSLRMNTISHAMEQLRLRRSVSDCESHGVRTRECSEIRAWFQSVERRLGVLEAELRSKNSSSTLTKLAADQQVLQLEIKTEGQALVSRLEAQVNRLGATSSCSSSSSSSEAEAERRRRGVAALTRRWHTVYLRSLSLQFQIEELIRSASQEREELEDPELLGPPQKRRRCSSLVTEDEGRDTDTGSSARASSGGGRRRGDSREWTEEEEEDVIPFPADHYEPFMACELELPHGLASGASSEDLDGGRKWDSTGLADVGYSSGENSIHEALDAVAADAAPPGSEEDASRRRRIESSPVKSFYKTVIDGADEEDEGRDPNCLLPPGREVQFDLAHNWFQKEPGMTDSMIVQSESMNNTMHTGDYEEVLALLDAEIEMPRRDSFADALERLPSSPQGTRWRQIRASVRRPGTQRNSREFLQIVDKHSCDASSEESEAGGDSSSVPRLTPMTSSFIETPSSSLKRTRERLLPPICPSSISSRRDSLKSCQLGMFDVSEMEASFCSTKSEFPKGRGGTRKKLRARRLPRSMSDGEHVGLFLNGSSTPQRPSIRVDAPFLSKLQLRNAFGNLDSLLPRPFAFHFPPHDGDSDSTTAHEQSDVPAYEWDEYNPPAKDEAGDDAATPSGGMVSSFTLPSTMDDDFDSVLASDAALRSLLDESFVYLRNARNSLSTQGLSPQLVEDVRRCAKANLARLDTFGRHATVTSMDEVRDLEAALSAWRDLLDRISSPVPLEILTKVEEFSNSLRDLLTTSALSPPISTKEDARIALHDLLNVRRKLEIERDHLRELLKSDMMNGEMRELTGEFAAIALGYDEAIERIGRLVADLDSLNNEWAAWNDTQNLVKSSMRSIEQRLTEGPPLDTKALLEELASCHERMASLETQCNYLSAHVADLRENSEDDLEKPKRIDSPDFAGELAVYANALKLLQNKFEELTREKPSTSSASTEVRERRAAQTQTRRLRAAKEVTERVTEVVRESWTVKFLLLCSLLFALSAWFCCDVLGYSFGPHLHYVRGPPPI